MKIGPRGGHNFQSPGASALNVGGLDEITEDRLVYISANNYLKRASQETIDCTPGRCGENEDLTFGTDKANNNNVDLFLPIHFNKAYDHYDGAIGSEIWLNPNNPKALEIGTRILANLQALGFKNRGLKDGMHLHDIRESNATAVLVEVCFCEATEDVRIYKAVGYEAVGKAISDGVVGSISPKIVTPTTVPVPVILPRVNNSIAQLQQELNNQGAHLVVDGFYGPKTLAACPLLRQGANGNITRWLQKRLALPVSPSNQQDGAFGPYTKNAVIKYQTAMGLDADGVVGQATWNALLR